MCLKNVSKLYITTDVIERKQLQWFGSKNNKNCYPNGKAAIEKREKRLRPTKVIFARNLFETAKELN